MKLVIAFAFAALATVVLGSEGRAEHVDEPLPVTQKKSNREIMSHIAMKLYGGKIRQPGTERGEIVFVNMQKTVDVDVLEKVMEKLERQFKYIVRISKEDLQSSPEQIVIRLEDSDRAERILLAPENSWVSLNVKSLAFDNPPKAILADRFQKEVRRAFAFVCGGTCGTETGGLCRMVNNLSDLDAIPGIDFALDVEARIVNNMHETGVRPYRIAKYSDAVAEGWAPPPTNDMQKAIWERVKAEQSEKPTNPMRILPGQKPSGK